MVNHYIHQSLDNSYRRRRIHNIFLLYHETFDPCCGIYMFVVCVVCNENSFEKRLYDRDKLDDKINIMLSVWKVKKIAIRRNTHKNTTSISYVHLVLDVPMVVDIHLCIGRANIFME